MLPLHLRSRTPRLILCILLGGILSAPVMADFPDGIWNGKPWSPSLLTQEVNKGNPDALAEWADCSTRVRLNIKYNPRLIQQRIQQAAKKGSILGQFLNAKRLIFSRTHDEKEKNRGYEIIKKLAAKKYPPAIGILGRMHIFGHGVPLNFKKAYHFLNQAKSMGDITSLSILAFLYAKPYHEQHNLRTAQKLYSQCLKQNHDIFAAVYIVEQSQHRITQDYPFYFSLETLSEAKLRIEQAANLNHPYALTFKATQEIEHGNPHLGIPLMIRAANMNGKAAIQNLIPWFSFGKKIDVHGKKQIIVRGTKSGAKHAAILSYRSGARDGEVVLIYAEALLNNCKNTDSSQYKKALKILKDQLLDNNCNAHTVLGETLPPLYFRMKSRNIKLHQRGLSHLIYHSNHQPDYIYQIACYYLSAPNDPSYNPSKGIAAAHYYIEHHTGFYQEQMRAFAKKSEQNLSPAQKEELRKLIDLQFPIANVFRKKAFDHLKEIGDLPKNATFSLTREAHH